MASENDFTSCDRLFQACHHVLGSVLTYVAYPSLPQTRCGIKEAACLCTVKQASPALPPSVSPT